MDRRGRDAHGRREGAHRLGPKMRQERVVANAHHVFRPGVADDGVEALRIGHRASRDEALGEPLGGFLDRRRPQWDHDVLGFQHVTQFHKRSLSRGTTSAGRPITEIPARSSAAIFSAAVPLEPEMIAPAWPMRRPGGAVCPATNPITGFVMACVTTAAACCWAAPPLSPIRPRAWAPAPAGTAGGRGMKLVRRGGPPPIPMQVDWP